ncbi:MAG: hypothetical protein BGO90_01935 [Legionella sp. 40-6]|mgnify:FL=1|nr:MAG: hypothetical protein BGO90_01935 [Legionella sp. 40-6]
MNFATYFLQTLYGGVSRPIPSWLKNMHKILQRMNKGYHPGRFINCIEVSLNAFKTLLENQGNYLPHVAPLSNFPPFISNYMEQLAIRIQELDHEKPITVNAWGYTYERLLNYITTHEIPFYSHLLVFADLKPLPGGHVFSGIVVPDAHNKPIVYFYDAQGFLPETWLHPEEFDQFYTLETVYIHQSPDTQKAIKKFIHFCQNHDSINLNLDIKQEENFFMLLQQRLQEYLKLECFRLQSNRFTSNNQSALLQAKLDQYEHLLEEITPAALSPERLGIFIKQTALVAAHHVYSFNWFNPQSFIHFFENSKDLVKHEHYTGITDITEMKNYLNAYLLKEILRLSQRNDATNYTLNKVEQYCSLLQELNQQEIDEEYLSRMLHKIHYLSQKSCHWLGMIKSPLSLMNYEEYLKPLEERIDAFLNTGAIKVSLS